MSTFLSIHDATKLAASTVQGGEHNCAAHFTINFEGESFENRGAVTFYTCDEILASRLITAINRIVGERKAELSADKTETA